MKITPKFLKGGAFDSLFTLYTPIDIKTPKLTPEKKSTSRKEKDTDDEKGKLSEKDFFTMLKDIDGLPNEMKSLVNNLINTFSLSEITGEDPGDLATLYLKNLYLIKILSLNKKKYDDAWSQANKNGALAEPAITMDGKLVVQDNSGKVQNISLESYFDHQEAYSPLSVSLIANLRAYSRSFENNQSSFEIMNNGIGFESFLALLDLAKLSLSSLEYSQSGMFAYNKKALEGLKVLQTLSKEDRAAALNAITSEGAYKYNVTDKDNIQSINYLIGYLSSVLPNRAKVWAAFKLQTPDKEKATERLISQYLLGKRNTSHKFDIDQETEVDENGNPKTKGSGKGSGSEEEPKTTYLTALQSGWGARKETRTFNPGNQSSFRVTGNVYGSFADQDGKDISDNTLSDLLSKTGISGISNLDSITFGDNIINVNSLSRVAIENNGGFRAILPCIKHGTKVIPNFELITSFDELVQEVNDELGSSATYDARLEALEEKIREDEELTELLDTTGKLDKNKFLVFFIVNGLASDLNFEFKSASGKDIEDESNPLIHETDNQEDINYFKRVTAPEDFDDFDSMWENLEWLNGHDKVYEGNVFIPILTNNRLAAIIFSGQKVKDSTGMSIEHEYQRYTTQQDLKQPNSEYLFQ